MTFAPSGDADATLEVRNNIAPSGRVVDHQRGDVSGPSPVMPLEKLHEIIRKGALEALGFSDENPVHPTVLKYLAQNIDARVIFKDSADIADVEVIA